MNVCMHGRSDAQRYIMDRQQTICEAIPISILCPALCEFSHVWDNPYNSTFVVCLFEQIEVIDLYKQNYSLVSVSIN